MNSDSCGPLPSEGDMHFTSIFSIWYLSTFRQVSKHSNTCNTDIMWPQVHPLGCQQWFITLNNAALMDTVWSAPLHIYLDRTGDFWQKNHWLSDSLHACIQCHCQSTPPRFIIVLGNNTSNPSCQNRILCMISQLDPYENHSVYGQSDASSESPVWPVRPLSESPVWPVRPLSESSVWPVRPIRIPCMVSQTPVRIPCMISQTPIRILCMASHTHQNPLVLVENSN